MLSEGSYFVHSVDEYNGKPCVLVQAGAFFYLLTSLEVEDDSIAYDLAVGVPVEGGKIDWLDDADVENFERHGDLADRIIADVIAGLG